MERAFRALKTHTNVLPSSRSVLAFIPISTRPLFSLPLRLSSLQRSILTHLHWRRHDRFPSVRPALPSPRSLAPSLARCQMNWPRFQDFFGWSVDVAPSPARERLFERHMQIACMV